MSLEQIRARAAQLAAHAERRRRQQGLAWSVALAGLLWAMWIQPTMTMRAGCAVVIAATLANLSRRYARRQAADPDDLNAATGRDFLRYNLLDRRDSLRGVLRWQIAPVGGGVAIMLIGMYLDAPARWQWPAAIWGVASVQVMVARWRIDRAVKDYDREIAALDG